MKEFFLPLTEPVGAVWALMALGVTWLVIRRQWRSAIWLGLPMGLMFLMGSTSLVEGLVEREEARWEGGTAGAGDYRTTEGQKTEPGPRTQVADAVLELGGGVRMSQFDGYGFATTDAWSRVMTAFELVRAGRAKTLVLGGSYPYPGKPGLASMAAVQDWVNAWGLAPGGVTNLGICLNTHDEAVAFKRLKDSQGWKSVILVTSALHMRRSEALFKKLGIDVEPVAADFEVYGVSQDLPFSVFPRQHRFRLWALYLHERIGCVVYGARGWG